MRSRSIFFALKPNFQKCFNKKLLAKQNSRQIFYKINLISLASLYTWGQDIENSLSEPSAKVRHPVPKLSKKQFPKKKITVGHTAPRLLWVRMDLHEDENCCTKEHTWSAPPWICHMLLTPPNAIYLEASYLPTPATCSHSRPLIGKRKSCHTNLVYLPD